ncbi:hypothetical protein [Vibrio aestuarianus]|uniref:hypothetical protein n=1 Tax=Vibrio aestuarianus TaxID=28171 RepID=UPI00237C677A|nr:hypothetical protein [Vibrio aestuarianus]MDE1330417.1 hypothetical protein [Vibrio aestuarianus]
MLNKISIEKIVKENIKSVLEDNAISLKNDIDITNKFVEDLGFNSLMIAQLIMLVQDEIESEPFLNDYAISDVKCVDDFCNVYYNEQKSSLMEII